MGLPALWPETKRVAMTLAPKQRTQGGLQRCVSASMERGVSEERDWEWRRYTEHVG